jgi:catechol 2,3-dioxygenase-like lactoylglutathione lyase family enzyme
MEQRLSLVTLGVSDLERAIAFYERLGWQRKGKAYEGVAFFDAGGVVLALYPKAALTAEAGMEMAAGGGNLTLAHNVASRAEVDAVVAAMQRAGGTLRKAPEAQSWGGYSGFVADPDGFVWEICHNPVFPLDAAGRVVVPD